VLLDELLAAFSQKDVIAGEEAARRELARLPVPLRSGDDPAADRRRELQRIAALLAAADGRPQELVVVLLRDYRDGASAHPLVMLLIATDQAPFAATVAYLALASPDCRDRDALEELLTACGRPPDQWSEALVDLARSPSVEAWDELQRFTPDDVYYDRARNALRVLRGLGVDPVLLFHIATRYGTTPDAIELVETGLVPPEVVAARGNESPAASMWLALAAVAAQARSDRLGVVRYLRDAWRAPYDYGLVKSLTLQVRESADPELQGLLDAAEVPPSEW
jgi:hypothetical protein